MRHIIITGGYDTLGYSTPSSHFSVDEKPGALWRKCQEKDLLSTWPGWRGEANAMLAQTEPGERRAALDEWAETDLVEGDYFDGSVVLILNDEDYREWLEEEEALHSYPVSTEGLRPIGLVRDCGCEDWPCCIHADSYAYI